jgi:ribonuclease P protein component
VQRLRTPAQFKAALDGGTVARTVHFALHRVSLSQPAASSATGPDLQALFAVGLLKGANNAPTAVGCTQGWLGAVVPKRWAKRAVTRNAIKRQIYAVSTLTAPQLPSAAYVVRLRAGFAADQFRSAQSTQLKQLVRTELQQLFAAAAAKQERA